MSKIVFLTGAGVSAESGISTFRDNGGLWEQYSIEDVCTPEGYERNPKLVLDFYNDMRAGLKDKQPNKAHELIAKLQEVYGVAVITQNVDNLHERAGSKNVIHLHGELTKACNQSKTIVEEIGYEPIHEGDMIAGSQARPFIVWFGESVPMMDVAIDEAQDADVFVVVGTSLNVYPAAGLLNYVGRNKRVTVYVIDPKAEELPMINPNLKMNYLKGKATTGMEKLCEELGISAGED